MRCSAHAHMYEYGLGLKHGTSLGKGLGARALKAQLALHTRASSQSRIRGHKIPFQ